MKNPVILAFLSILLFSTLPTKAQDTPKDSTNYIGCHIFTLAPLGLINKIRIRYEYVASKRMTYGAQASYYFNNNYFPGIQLLAISKYYLSKLDKSFGYYLMGQLGFAYHQGNAYEGPLDNYIPSSNNIYAPHYYSHRVQASGLIYGIALGHQRFVGGKQRLVIDGFVGIRGFVMNKYLDDVYILDKFYGTGILSGPTFEKNQFSNVGISFGTQLGVGGFINCGINLGYRF